jgi:hypothetical protein
VPVKVNVGKFFLKKGRREPDLKFHLYTGEASFQQAE